MTVDIMRSKGLQYEQSFILSVTDVILSGVG